MYDCHVTSWNYHVISWNCHVISCDCHVISWNHHVISWKCLMWSAVIFMWPAGTVMWLHLLLFNPSISGQVRELIRSIWWSSWTPMAVSLHFTQSLIPPPTDTCQCVADHWLLLTFSLTNTTHFHQVVCSSSLNYWLFSTWTSVLYCDCTTHTIIGEYM